MGKKPEEEKPGKEPSPQYVVQMRDDIVLKTQGIFAKRPPGSVRTFTVGYVSPEGVQMEFSISPRTFKNKSDEDVLVLIKEQIEKQMAGYGIDISLLAVETSPSDKLDKVQKPKEEEK